MGYSVTGLGSSPMNAQASNVRHQGAMESRAVPAAKLPAFCSSVFGLGGLLGASIFRASFVPCGTAVICNEVFSHMHI